MIGIEVLVSPECPNADLTEHRIREVAARLGSPAQIRRRVVRDEREAARLGFPGSPTVRIEGEELEPGVRPTDSPGPRRYDGGAGAPPTWLIEAGILRARKPRRVLFLCVANSARSQMAEAIARSLAPGGVRVSSAGSEPTRVRPQAIQVLAEIGIDASGQRSKSLDEFASQEIDCVVTLCAEENCPAWLGGAVRVHWPLPDPAAAGGAEEEVVESFREVRDELRRRLAAMFGTTAT